MDAVQRVIWVKTHWGRNKMADRFTDDFFKINILQWKVLYFISNFTEIHFQVSNYQYAHIGSDIGFAPIRPQAIIWTNDGQVHIHASPTGFNELTAKKPMDLKWPSRSLNFILDDIINGPLIRYVKLRVAYAPGMPGKFPPSPTSKETAS